jgi:hypothetical protein
VVGNNSDNKETAIAKIYQRQHHQQIILKLKSFINTYNMYNSVSSVINKIEPRHDKTNIVRVRPAWIQTSLQIRAV